MDDYEIVASIVGDNHLIATLSEYPYQGIQTLIDKVYLWNPSEANELIVKLNELIEEIIINRDYNRLNNKPVLDTDNEESLGYVEDETIQGTIKLHRVAKTGSYNSLRDLPPLGELAAKDQIKDEDVADDAEIARSKLAPDVVASLGLADTAIQPDDNISELTNDADYQNGSQVTTSISEHNTSTTAHSDIRSAISAKQDKLTAGEGIVIDENNVISTFSSVLSKYLSVERLDAYIYKATFDAIPEYDPSVLYPVNGACTSFVRNGKLYRNYDWKYDNTAEFIVVCKDFQGMASIFGMNDGALDIKKIEQLPYHLVDGVNKSGIKVSTHVLYNDWTYAGAGDKDQDIMLLPYYILSNLHDISNINTVLGNYVSNIKIPEILANAEYLLQFVVTDGTTTYCIMPPASETGSYVIQDITSNPKLTNFRWVSDATVVRADLQTRPTGVERWNAVATSNLEDLRFTKCYEESTRLSEFIGIDDTTKDSTDAELTVIYNRAHTAYQTRTRDGVLWQTVHSIVLGADSIEHLWCQEDWDTDYICASKSELEAETDARIAGDETLDAKIFAEQQARQAGDTALGTRIDNEITRATDAESALSDRITENADAISAETTAREQADEILQGQLDSLSTHIDAETQNRIDADNALSGRITTNENAIADINNELATYGDIVTHDADEFATAAQGAKADTAIQPNDNVSELTNDATYQTQAQVNTAISAHNTSETAHNDIREAINDKQDTLTAGDNIDITGAVISATDTTYTAGNGLTLTGTEFSANVINNTTSDSTTDALSAAAGKSLQEQVNSLLGRGKYLSIWDCTTGLAMDEPPVNPYTVETGSYFIIGKVAVEGGVNYRPNGGIYDKDVPSTAVETGSVKVNDTYFYDGTQWRLLDTPEKDVSFSTLAGSPYDNTNLANALDSKQATISDLGTIRSNASAGKSASDTIATYGDVVTHNTSEFATSSQGAKADTAIQPNDNISELTNDSGYQTQSQVNTAISTHNTSDTAHNDIRTTLSEKADDSDLQAHIADTDNPHSVTKAQVGLGNVDNTSDADKPISTATQSALDGKQATISDLATIRSNAQAGKAASDTIATYGDIVTHDVAEFATAAQGTKADTALQTGDNVSELVNDAGFITNVVNDLQNYTLTSDLATVATSGSYNDLSNKPTISTTLAGLTGDVSISSPSGGEHLVYDAVAGKWKNTPSAATVSWGGVTGTLSDQADLQDALDAKLDADKAYHPDLFDWKWADHEISDMSWLRADTFSWQDGTVYSNAYQHLVDDVSGKTLQTETVGGTTISFYLADDGHKICPAAQESNVTAIYTATGIAWYYILDTDNTRFKLPRTKFGVTGLRDTVGNYVAPGAPSIVGTFKSYNRSGTEPTASGSFSISAHQSINASTSSGTGYVTTYNFNAANSSSVYGNSTTVQPPATQQYLYFYVGQFSQSAVEQTAGLNASLFNGKADIDLGNITNAGKEVCAHQAMPGVRYINLTLGSSGASYTAPADGYFALASTFDTNGYLYMYRDSGVRYGTALLYNANTWIDSFIPVAKGDVIIIQYNGTASVQGFKFIYANGAQ